MREAVVTLDDAELEALGFGELVSLCRRAGIRDVDLLEDDGYTCVPQIVVGERLAETELDALECVDDWERIAEREDGYVYVLELTATGLPEEVAADHAELVGGGDTAITERGLLLSLVGSQTAIRDVLRHYEASGASPDLRKLAAYDGGERTLDSLTDRQQEVLETAYELGFYEVPRESSTADVAAALNLDPATVSEHLQRAERNLLTQELPG